jgi:uncharacterized membrane protein
MNNPKSTAHIAGHPLHPMLIPFPIAFFVATFVADLVFWRSGNADWAAASVWLLGAALVTAALAAVAGLIDFLGESRIRQIGKAWWHAGGNVLALLLSLWNFFVRYGHADAAHILPTGLVLSTIVVALLLVTGWLGGELVFRGRVGVADDPPR